MSGSGRTHAKASQHNWHTSCLLLAEMRVCICISAVGAQRYIALLVATTNKLKQGLLRVLLGSWSNLRWQCGVVGAGLFTTSRAVCCGANGMQWRVS